MGRGFKKRDERKKGGCDHSPCISAVQNADHCGWEAFFRGFNVKSGDGAISSCWGGDTTVAFEEKGGTPGEREEGRYTIQARGE